MIPTRGRIVEVYDDIGAAVGIVLKPAIECGGGYIIVRVLNAANPLLDQNLVLPAFEREAATDGVAKGWSWRWPPRVS